MRTRFPGISWAILAFVLFSLTALTAHTARAEGRLPPFPGWPQHASKLKADPSVTFGVLPNGVRYAVMPNSHPAKRVNMHLVVQSGSLQEREDQRGLAHFMEHIAFCGSTHFKPGELIHHFQRLGMNFGADANAHTGFDETVYDVHLPDGQENHLRDGLRILRDFAGEALILDSEVDRERGVILAEKTARDSQGYRNLIKELEFYFPGSRLPARMPIGLEKVIKAADAKLLRDYYDTWYRPERMAVVAVGDVEPEQMTGLITDYFGDLKSRAPARPDPKLPPVADFAHNGLKTFFAVNPESATSTVSVTAMSDSPQARGLNDGPALRRDEMLHRLAVMMFNERLAKLAEKQGGTLLSGMGIRYDLMNAYTMTAINGECEPDQWKACLGLLEKQLRSSLTWGFRPDELERAQKRYTASLDAAVKTRNARTSRELAQELMASLGREDVFLSPEQERDLLAPMIAEADLEAVQTAWNSSWDDESRAVGLESPAPLKDKFNPEFSLAAAWNRSKAVPIPTPGHDKTRKLVLPELQEPGRIVRRETVQAPDLTIVEFANGIRLHIMRTEFEKGRANINLVFGNGFRGQKNDQPGLARLAVNTIQESGMLGLGQREVNDALAGRILGFKMNVGPGRFIGEGFCLSGEEEFLLRLIRGNLYDVTWTQSAFAKAQTELVKDASVQNKTVNAVFQSKAVRFFTDGNNRLGRPGPEAYAKYTLKDVREWIEPYLTQAPLEVNVVGDVDVEAVIDSVARVFGSLPRRDYHARDYGTARFPEGKELALGADSDIAQAAVSVSFPSCGYEQHRDRLGMKLVAEIFGERLRKRIRETLGMTYSPWVGAMPLAAYPGYGLLMTHVSATPETTRTIAREVKTQAGRFLKQGITQDELERARKPAVNALIEDRQSNAYWMEGVLMQLSRYPQQVQWSRDAGRILKSLSASDLDKLAAEYLQPEKAATLTVTSGN